MTKTERLDTLEEDLDALTRAVDNLTTRLGRAENNLRDARSTGTYTVVEPAPPSTLLWPLAPSEYPTVVHLNDLNNRIKELLAARAADNKIVGERLDRISDASQDGIDARRRLAQRITTLEMHTRGTFGADQLDLKARIERLEKRSVNTHHYLAKLWRSGWDPQWDHGRYKDDLLISQFIVAANLGLDGSGHSRDLPHYPLGYHWTVEDDGGNLRGVYVNRLSPDPAVFE